MNSIVLLVGVCVVAALAVSEARDLTSSALEQLFHKRRQAQGPAGGSGCPVEPSVAIMECLRPLEQLESITPGLLMQEIDTEEAMDILCRALAETTACVKMVHEFCGEEDMMVKILLETVEGVGGYLCSPEIRQQILEETECWENPQASMAVMSCPEKHRLSPGSDHCAVVESMITCVKNGVASHCSDRAAKIVARLFYLAVEPMASEMMDCNLQVRVARSVMNLLPMTRRR